MNAKTMNNLVYKLKTIFKNTCLFLWHKKILLVFILIVLFISGFFIFRNLNKSGGYIIENAKKTSLEEIVSESGTISSSNNIPIYSPTNGVISQIFVKNEDKVSAGQELFKVTSSATEYEKQIAYANYMTAKAALDSDTANLYTLQSGMFAAWKEYTDLSTSSTYENADKSPNTTNRTLPEFTTVQNDWLAAEANYKNQQSVIAKAQATLNSALTAYNQTQNAIVKTPIDGIISNITLTTGGSVHSQSALNPNAKAVLVIKNNNDLEAVIPVGQTNIAKVEIGQKAVIIPDAYKNRSYDATVVRIDSIGENNLGVVTYNVYLEVKSDSLLKTGMTFDADITTKKLTNVLTVPNSAVVLENGVTAVRVLKNNAISFIPVTTGVKGETRTQILNGISEGQNIIVSLTNEKAERPGFLGL